MGESPIRILVVEDNAVYRSSLELLLEMQDGLEVVGGVGDGRAAAATAAELRPDVVLMDFRLPGLDGAEATAALRAVAPDAAVVCLTAEASPEEREAVLAAGAVSLIGKDEPVDRLASAIRDAAGKGSG